MESKLKEIIKKFDILGDLKPYGEGHINDTFLLSSDPKYILQRINTDIFKDPAKLMENIRRVTDHLNRKVRASGGDEKREALRIIKTLDGKDFLTLKDGNSYRMYLFIDDTTTYQKIEEPSVFYHAAKAFGKFQKNLSDFPASTLHESIPDFHNTVKRFENFKKAVSEDKKGRLKDVKKEVDFILKRESLCSVVLDEIKKGTVPLRVTHNDTKLNNVLIDNKTGEGICVVDLDTVMPGSLLYDFGDSLRFGANNSFEDDTNLENVFFRLDLFDVFTKGYLEEVKDSLTQKEIELLATSAKLMTLECGMRFLEDHLNGDTYFKIHRENHNLDRARTQLKLVWDMEQKEKEMEETVKKYL